MCEMQTWHSAEAKVMERAAHFDQARLRAGRKDRKNQLPQMVPLCTANVESPPLLPRLSPPSFNTHWNRTPTHLCLVFNPLPVSYFSFITAEVVLSSSISPVWHPEQTCCDLPGSYRWTMPPSASWQRGYHRCSAPTWEGLELKHRGVRLVGHKTVSTFFWLDCWDNSMLHMSYFMFRYLNITHV